MTGLATGSIPSTTEAPSPDGPASDAASYEWAPAEPARRKRRLGLWLGIPGAVLVVGAVAASLILIAPGAAVAGVGVGGLTVGGAADAISHRLAHTSVEFDTPTGAVTLTGADLGATVDAEALAQTAHTLHPLWNVTQWNSAPLPATVSIDPVVAGGAMRSALGQLYVDPTDAKVAFDAASGTYAVTDAKPGKGIDVETVRAALEQAFTQGTTAKVSAAPIDVEAPVTTAEAQQAAATLNHMLDTAGFYVGDERTVPIDRPTLASWLTVGQAGGQITLSSNAAAIQPAVDALAGQVNRAAVNGTVVTNSSGDVLQTLVTGTSGRQLGDTSGIADAFAAQLAAGDARYALPVTEVAAQMTTLQRFIDVNLSAQRVTLYENGGQVDSWLVSSGAPGFETHTGTFRIGWKTESQTMRGYNGDGSMYETPNVKWAAYFNGDEAFHGVYWHNNFGHQMSHGCVGMPEWRAEQLYDWAPEGVDVSVHY